MACHPRNIIEHFRLNESRELRQVGYKLTVLTRPYSVSGKPKLSVFDGSEITEKPISN
jgi:hypothetical protein